MRFLLCKVLLVMVAIVTVAFWRSPIVSADDAAEIKLVAAYIYRLSLLVKAPDPQPDIFNFCIYGVTRGDELKGYLEKFLEQKKGVSKVSLINSVSSKTVSECNYIYLGEESENHIDEALASLRTTKAISISNLVGFSDRGGMFQLVTRDGRMIPRINMTKTKEASIVIDGNLLTISEAHH